jgi:hypothetical protein
MLAEDIIRIGRPIANSALSNEMRIRWLTDVDNEVCKNFFQNVFLVEILGESVAFHYLQVGSENGDRFEVDQMRNTAFPIIYPNGGNPLRAQGIYPVPVYLMYNDHIKGMGHPQQFASEVIFPRLKKTVCYRQARDEHLRTLAQKVADVLSQHSSQFIVKEKQLGILYIFDSAIPVFQRFSDKKAGKQFLWIAESKIETNIHLFLNSDVALEGIIEARFSEAKELGYKKRGVSTFTNHGEEELVSIYNKSWLWLSPTWDLPKSIYWEDDEWTNGIKVDRASYEAFLYGTQFLKQITVPISQAILKEMFSPVMSAEAKKNMKSTSFEPIYGVPMVVPLISGDSQQLYQKYSRILKRTDLSDSDLHLEILAGINRTIPRFTDDHRINLLYYSGDLSRGNMHIRMMIPDIVPSVAEMIQSIVREVNSIDLYDIRRWFSDSNEQPNNRTRSLPSLISNAFGPAYVWSVLLMVFHKQPLRLERLFRATSRKLTEMANKEDHWGMVDELVFHYTFLSFYEKYSNIFSLSQERVNTLDEWNRLLTKYRDGTISLEDLQTAEQLGFVTGLLLKQFSNSYRFKTGQEDFVRHRVMKFGTQLRPEMIWKSGVLRCKELKEQWDMNLASNFEKCLAVILLAFIEADNKKILTREKDRFMTTFWSGYLTYKKEKNEED